ncbi:MAG TPA: bifunctional nicotinamidase/pyrazinamidase [Chloroflexota bacterium]|nr:bifunctional nicotinamidase/pyrazinamidase [Chloroflexota bacterium]
MAEFQPGDALLLVDPQNDFCPGGSLAVPEGDAVMPVLNAWAEAAQRAGVPIFVSRDWHPPTTTHFQTGGGVWPVHCVAGTPGAEFHPQLRLPARAIVVSKGMGPTEDAYSAFQARDEAGTPLPELLQRHGVRRLYVMGLATDYCVKASALAGLEAGLEVIVVPEGIRAVNLQPRDGEQALDEMRAAGARVG